MKKRRVCMVSYDVLGPIKNGGIGTAMTACAEALAAEGHAVTILYPSAFVEDRSLSFWTLAFAERGLAFHALYSEEGPLANAYLIYQWLKERAFDVVHFHDWRGPGYWACAAKRQNLAFQNTVLVCQVHGQTYWHLTSSSEFLSQVSELELDFQERRAVEWADAVFSPSQYMIDFMRGRGWAVPANPFVSPNLLPQGFPQGAEPGQAGRKVEVDELVFFGRLEARKGVEIFCDAVSRLLAAGHRPRKVTFLGKEGLCGTEPTTAVISRAAARWTVPFAIINDRDVFGARQYLAGPGRLAVIASVIENSPYTVLESLAAGIPFVAADVGGVGELIAPEDRADVLYRRDPRQLAERLAQVLTGGARLARPATGFAAARQRWLDWHATLVPAAAPPAKPVGETRERPLVSVCMSHFSRPDLLRIALASVEAQTYPNIQLVLIDDASPDAATKAYLDSIEPGFRERGWKLIRNQSEVWTGAARNLAVSHADGTYVLLMDDDNVARPEEVETFVTAALATDADILTCQQQPFVGRGAPPPGRAELPIGWMSLGPNLSQAVYQNCLGDLNMMVRRSAWTALGGFTEDRYGCEDWEFLINAVHRGYRLEVVPEMLFYYRHSGENLAYRYGADALYKSNKRQLRPVLGSVPEDLRLALQLAVETRQQDARKNREGYWRPADGPNSVSVRVGRMPLNSGQALVELAKVAFARQQFDSAVLLYTQALRNDATSRLAMIDDLDRWGGSLDTEVLVDFLREPRVWEEEAMLPQFLAGARVLERRAAPDALRSVLRPALERHPDSEALRAIFGAAERQLDGRRAGPDGRGPDRKGGTSLWSRMRTMMSRAR